MCVKSSLDRARSPISSTSSSTLVGASSREVPTSSTDSTFPSSNPHDSRSPSIHSSIIPQVNQFNEHHMLTRAKTSHSKPIVLLAQVEPVSIKQALAHLDWLNSMKSEYEALLANRTWSLTPLPPHRKPVGCKWVFKLKENPDFTINKYKAHLVAKGFY